MSRVHPVFSVGLLRPFQESEIKEQVQQAPPAVIVDEGKEFEVQEILDRHRIRNCVEYLVSWKGYGPAEDSWEPEDAVKNAQELVNKFNKKHPDAEKWYKKTRRSGRR